VTASARPGRRSKVIDLAEAAAAVPAGCHLALGGFLFHNRPSALVRAVARRGGGGLHLYSCPTASFDADLLIGMGLVAETVLAHVSFDYLGPAPFFKDAAERGTVEVVPCDEVTVAGGYMATVEGIPYHPVHSAAGHDIGRASRLVRPYVAHTGHRLWAVSPLAPEVLLLHAQEADPWGNVRHLGAVWGDELMAKASRRVIVEVDRVVDPAVVRADPRGTTVPGHLVDAVVETPYGAHPGASHLRYLHDEAHLRAYLAAAWAAVRDGDRRAFEAYVDRHVAGPRDHAGYLASVGGPEALAALAAPPRGFPPAPRGAGP
jgi:glutaconate CoA-transferase subunit A